MRPLIPRFVILTLLCSVLLGEAAWFRRTKSITFDETFYLSCGLQTVHNRWIDPRIAGEGVGPLPVLLNYVPPLLFQRRQERPEPWTGQPGDRQLIDGPRFINSVLAGAVLVMIVFVWLDRRAGLAAATCGSGFVALSPSIVGHASLATTDVSFAVFALAALAALAWFLKAPGKFRLMVLTIGTGAALTAKYSAVFLLPTIGLMLFLSRFRSRLQDLSPSVTAEQRQSWSSRAGAAFWSAGWSSLRTYALFLALLAPICWGFHLFSFTGPLKNVPLEETPDSSPWVRLLGRGPLATRFMDVAHRHLKRPAPIAGITFQYLHNEAGHPAYLMGERSPAGWWYYFPCAFAFKSTPAELMLTAGLLGVIVLSGRKLAEWNLDLQVLLVGATVFGLLLLTSRIAIGHRYLILLYPLMAIVAFDRLFQWPRRRLALGVAVLLLIGQTVSNAAISPHFLAYFNRASGGPEHGHELLVDANIDWGQDLPALRQALAERKDRAVAISYFGTADLASYGIAAEPVASLSRDPDDYTALAVSVTHLQGVYVAGDDPFRGIRRFTPAASAGYSILLFDLNTPEKRAAFRRAAHQVKQGTAERERQRLSVAR